MYVYDRKPVQLLESRIGVMWSNVSSRWRSTGTAESAKLLSLHKVPGNYQVPNSLHKQKMNG